MQHWEKGFNMSAERCPLCHGRKQIKWVGGFMRECTDCFGVGYVSTTPVNFMKDNDEIDSVKKKPGRPKIKDDTNNE